MPKARQKDHNYKPLKNVGVSLMSGQNMAIQLEHLKGSTEFESEPAEVLDIILDEHHESYESPEDIGTIRARLLYSELDLAYKKDEWKSSLHLMRPADPDIKVYPLKHEIVLCSYNLSNDPRNGLQGSGADMIPQVLYYTKILNTGNGVAQNTMTDVSLSYSFKNGANYVVPSENKLYGESFIPNEIIRPLKHNEGDKVLEGRSGNSIRLGSEDGNGQDPSLLIRNKQSSLVSETDVIINEDINEDGSSIWITSNKLVPIELSSNKWDQFTNIPELNGNQIIFNSDRLVLNAKKDDLILSAKNSILTSAKNEIGLNSKYFTVNSDNIFLGKYDKCQPVVLGNELISLLYELLGALTTMTVATAAGVSTVPINAANFVKLINKLNTIVSKKAFVE